MAVKGNWIPKQRGERVRGDRAERVKQMFTCVYMVWSPYCELNMGLSAAATQASGDLIAPNSGAAPAHAARPSGCVSTSTYPLLPQMVRVRLSLR